MPTPEPNVGDFGWGTVLNAYLTNQENLQANHQAASTGVHGVAGAVVGTSDAQTLTNKTLTSPTVNTPTITAPTITGSLTGVGGALTSYAPATANFTVGNGTVSGWYRQIGKSVFVRMIFTAGSTSTYTATAATLGLPVAANASGRQVLTAFMNGNVAGIGNIAAGASVVTPLFSSSTTNPLLTGVTTTTFNPGTTGGELVIEGTYECA